MDNEELAIKIQGGETELLPQLWDQVRDLVGWYAVRFYNRRSARCIAAGTTVDDLVQEGFFVVLDAVKVFDPSSGYRFTTYLKYPCMNRFKEATGGRDNNKKEPLNLCTSLDVPMGEDSDTNLVDMIADPGDAYAKVDADDYRTHLRHTIGLLLNRLKPIENQVLRKYFYDGLTFSAIGEMLGLPFSKVREIKQQGLRQLRKYENFKELEAIIDERVSFNSHVGVTAFKSSWSSSVERIVEKRDNLRNSLLVGRILE
jgi:RNA polymerase sporulation-specific sigma factor